MHTSSVQWGGTDHSKTSPTTRSDVLLAVLACLERGHVRWCLLNGYKGYPGYVASDVDLIVDPADFSRVPRLLADISGVALVQSRLYEATAVTYSLASTNAHDVTYLQVDVSCDIRGDGRILFTAEDFLRTRRKLTDIFWVASPGIEFAHYLLKKIGKSCALGEQAFNVAHEHYLSEQYALEPNAAWEYLQHLFPTREASMVRMAAQTGHWAEVKQGVSSLYEVMLAKDRMTTVLERITYWRGRLRQIRERLIRRTGLVVCLLGPDGAGKTSVIERVSEQIAPAFSHVNSYHLTPWSLRTTGPVTDPQGRRPRGTILSVLRLAAWYVQFTVGYILGVVPQLVRSTGIVFDRYYHDLLVDQKRYRYGGPLWLAKIVGKLVPKPDLWIVLDAPADVLQSRKRELTVAEMNRQRKEYLALVKCFPNYAVVDASKSVDDVAMKVNVAILSFLANRTATRLNASAPSPYTS